MFVLIALDTIVSMFMLKEWYTILYGMAKQLDTFWPSTSRG